MGNISNYLKEASSFGERTGHILTNKKIKYATYTGRRDYDGLTFIISYFLLVYNLYFNFVLFFMICFYFHDLFGSCVFSVSVIRYNCIQRSLGWMFFNTSRLQHLPLSKRRSFFNFFRPFTQLSQSNVSLNIIFKWRSGFIFVEISVFYFCFISLFLISISYHWSLSILPGNIRKSELF